MHLGISAFRSPNQGLDCSFCRWITGHGLAEKECCFHRHRHVCGWLPDPPLHLLVPAVARKIQVWAVIFIHAPAPARAPAPKKFCRLHYVPICSQKMFRKLYWAREAWAVVRCKLLHTRTYLLRVRAHTDLVCWLSHDKVAQS